jgi:hypothetical protein
MAPVAGGVAHGEEDGLILTFRGCEGFFAPGVPVHGVVGVLEEVGALFGEETVGWVGGLGFFFVAIGGVCHNPIVQMFRVLS